MVSGVDVIVSAFCLREGSSARSCSMTQPVVTPVGRALSGAGVSGSPLPTTSQAPPKGRAPPDSWRSRRTALGSLL